METESPQLAIAAQVSLLQKCLSAVSRILRTDGSSLLAAKLLVISRNLHRALGKDGGGDDILTSVGDRLASLRQKLLRRIDRRFKRSSETSSDLVEDMAAFSLATSSLATDVVRHFQHLRLQSIGRSGEKAIDAANRLKVYLNTQREIRSVFPELLQASLKAVAARPLLQDPEISKLTELSLDVYQPWVTSDVKNFTPYSRHENLQHDAAKQLLDSWTEDALKGLLQSIERDVNEIEDVGHLVRVREEVLQLWLSSKRYNSTITGRDILDRLRAPFLQRLSVLSQTNFSKVTEAVQTRLDAALDGWDPNSKTLVVAWELAASTADLSNAAMPFRKAVRDRRHGSGVETTEILDVFEKRWQDVRSFQDVLQSMREVRWDEGVEEDEDSDDEYRAADLLSKRDPQELIEVQKSNTTAFFTAFELYLEKKATADRMDCANPSSPGLFLLRIIREFRSRIPRLLQDINVQISKQLLCSDIVAKIQALLIQETRIFAADDFARVNAKALSLNYRLDSIWEGTPPLPVQLSPTTFKFLRNLVKHMESFGADVWSPDAVELLKSELRQGVAEALKSHISALEQQPIPKTTTNGTNAHAEQDNGAVAVNGHSKSIESNGIEKDMESNSKGHETNGVLSESDTAATSTKEEEPTAPELVPGDKKTDVPPAYDESPEDKTSRLTRNYIQIIFDALYLDYALSAAKPDESADRSLQDVASTLIKKTELAERSVVKLRKSSSEYWRRTYLLFGLLCT